MFINNIQRKINHNNQEKDCLCTIFENKHQINNKQQRQHHKYNNKKQINLSKISQQSKKVSISGFKKMTLQPFKRQNQSKIKEINQKQELVSSTHSNIYKRTSIHQINRVQMPLQISSSIIKIPNSNSLGHLQTFIIPNPIYHRRIIHQQIPIIKNKHQPIFCSNRPEQLSIPKQDPFNRKTIFLRNQIQLITPQSSMRPVAFMQSLKPIKQEVLYEIQESKKSKQGFLSKQSTQFHRQSKQWSQIRQDYNNKSFQKSQIFLQETVPFVSEIQAIVIEPEKSGFLKNYKSIESIDNTVVLDGQSANVSYAIDKPVRFERFGKQPELNNERIIRPSLFKTQYNLY